MVFTGFDSLAPGKFEWNFRYVIFKGILVITGWDISCEIALIWMSVDFTDDKSTLVQVMAWCRQATSHYLNQCWPRSPTPYGVTRPQWVNRNILVSAPKGWIQLDKCIIMYLYILLHDLTCYDQGKLSPISKTSFSAVYDSNPFHLCEFYLDVFFKSLWLSTTICWHIFGSTLAWLMACFLTAPGHNLNQCWLVAKCVLWNSPESNFTRSAHEHTVSMFSEITLLKSLPHLPGANDIMIGQHWFRQWLGVKRQPAIT